MRVAVFAISILSFFLCGAILPQRPLQKWRAGIEEQNKDYSQVHHGMLKIQDCAYLWDGQSALLEGQKGDPNSWRWSRKRSVQGHLTLSLMAGTLTIKTNGKLVGPFDPLHGLVVDDDVDISGQTTQVAAGVIGWRIFIFNQKNPAAINFKGVSYFPYDHRYRVVARFQPAMSLSPRVFRTSRGTDKQFYHVGDARFTIQGKSMFLPFYADTNNSSRIHEMSAFFTDDLTGHGAYGAGRYVDVLDYGNYPPSSITIDFNTAYNPNCARSPCFTCPLAIDRLPLAIRAGERDPHMQH